MNNPNTSLDENTLRFTLKRRSRLGLWLHAPGVWIKHYRLLRKYKGRRFAAWIAFRWTLPMLRMMKEHGFSNITVRFNEPDKTEAE